MLDPMYYLLGIWAVALLFAHLGAVNWPCPRQRCGTNPPPPSTLPAGEQERKHGHADPDLSVPRWCDGATGLPKPKSIVRLPE